MKKVKLLTLLMSVILLFSLCACGEETAQKTFNELIGVETVDEITSVQVKKGDGREITLTTEEIKKIYDVLNKEYTFKQTEQSTGFSYQIVLTTDDSKYYIIPTEDQLKIGDDIYTLNGTIDMSVFDGLDWQTITEAFRDIVRTHESELGNIVILDKQLNKQIVITDKQQCVALYNAFNVNYERIGTDRYNAEDYRYWVEFVNKDDANGANDHYILYNDAQGNEIIDPTNEGKYKAVDKDIDWTLLKNLDWSKAEDIKE